MSVHIPGKFLLMLFVAGLMLTPLILIVNGLEDMAVDDPFTSLLLWLWVPGVPGALVLYGVIHTFVSGQRISRGGGGPGGW